MRTYFLFLLITSLGFGQDLAQREGELVVRLQKLREAIDDQEKLKLHGDFKEYLKETIELPGAMDYPFDQLRTLGSVKSPDNSLRVFTWNVEMMDETQKYGGLLLFHNKKRKRFEVSELIDNSLPMDDIPSETLDPENWYGALYYKVIPIEKSGREAYTLLGWDGNSPMSTRKIIDVLYFAGSTPKLGSPIFKSETESTLRRVVFEYSKKTTMHLNYEEDRGRIMFDHLAPESPSLKGMYMFYVPDLSYDSYVLEKNKWIFKADVIGVNPEEETKQVIYVQNEKTGQIEEKVIKNKWNDPSNETNKHVAVTPEDAEQATQQQNDQYKLTRKERKNIPESYNPLNNKKKKRKKR